MLANAKAFPAKPVLPCTTLLTYLQAAKSYINNNDADQKNKIRYYKEKQFPFAI